MNSELYLPLPPDDEIKGMGHHAQVPKAFLMLNLLILNFYKIAQKSHKLEETVWQFFKSYTQCDSALPHLGLDL